MSKPNNPSQITDPAHKLELELGDFAGKWRLIRNIWQSSGDEFVFAGEATFSRCEVQLVYKETGLVTAPNGKRMEAERTYLWRQGAGNQIDVFFDDNRFFHHFSLLRPYASHLCGNDQYRVSYSFGQWPVWESSWQVKGPRKDYDMVSRYQPL